MYEYGQWPRYKSVAERRADAAKAVNAASKKGQTLAPIAIDGRQITQTFWGTAWCDNLERYRDFAYRLDRGRSYVRSGNVIDLRLEAGKIEAQVVGSQARPYRIAISIERVPAPQWKAIQRDCAGSIGSLVDLLAGKLSNDVMARLCVERTGLFPTPAEIAFSCSCPDYATMCKHVAAVMYGIGARLDATPELLFTLRKVTADELLAGAAREMPAARPAPKSARVLAAAGLSDLFGIDLAAPPDVDAAPAASASAVPSGAALRTGRTKPAPVSAPRTKVVTAAKPRTAAKPPTVAKRRVAATSAAKPLTAAEIRRAAERLEAARPSRAAKPMTAAEIKRAYNAARAVLAASVAKLTRVARSAPAAKPRRAR